VTLHINRAWILLAVAALTVNGCTNTAPDQSTETTAKLATDLDPATTQPSYWFDLAGLTVQAKDFDRLWKISAESARDFGFQIDRRDYRGGVLTTVPLTSAQWFEFWRSDVRTLDGLEESSIATVRRTVRFEFTRENNGAYKVSPKVLIERESIQEQRITSVVSYAGIFRRPLKTRDRPTGTRESDVGIILPYQYWYPIGRDQALEVALVDSIEKKLR
jgi:hypothetical protein